MDKRIFIPPPDTKARCELFHLVLEERPVSEDIDIDELARITKGLISSDLKLIANNAALKALQENSLISMKLLVQDAKLLKPSLSLDELKHYREFEGYRGINFFKDGNTL